jgi:sRNA-binding regulator protein Hfq
MTPANGKHRRKRKGGPPTARRTPPPEGTGVETEYLNVKREKGVPMVVELLDGKAVRGVIRYFDQDMIKLEGESGPGLFIRKKDIRHMHAVDGD